MDFYTKYKDKSVEELREAFRQLQAEMATYSVDANGERKTSFTKTEGKRIHEILDEQDYLGGLIAVKESGGEAPAPGAPDGGFDTRKAEPFGLGSSIWPGQKRDYNALFNREGRSLDDGGFRDLQDFMTAVWHGRDARLFEKRSMVENTPSEGGFLLSEKYASMLWTDVIEDAFMMKSCRLVPIKSGNSIKVPAWEIGDHSSNLFGGVIAYWKGEEGSLTDVNPDVREMELKPKKLTILCTASGELVDDVPNFDSDVVEVLRQALKWYLNYNLLRGDGAGKPLGLLNAPSIVNVDKESGQAADTIEYKNVKKMYARMAPASQRRAVWIANYDTKPDLLEMTIPVGTGGSAVQVMKESNGQFTILGRPVMFSEKMPTLGDANDIVFADLSQYLVGLRGDIQVAKSPDVYFTTHKIAYRLIIRADGQHAWNEALTPKEGSTLSPVVGLKVRA